MIHNSFRRIALAQGLLPARNYLSEVAEPDVAPGLAPGMAPDLATLVAYAAEAAREPTDSATQV
jgi:hypothetical protein